MAKKKDNKAILIAYYEDMSKSYGGIRDGKVHDGLVVYLMDYDTGERSFICSNIFRTASGYENEEPNQMHFGLFKDAVRWHELHGYPIRWVSGDRLDENMRVRG